MILFSSCEDNNLPNTNDGTNSVNGIDPNITSVRKFLVDKNATLQTAALFYNLKLNAQKGIMIGQQDPFNGRYVTDGGSQMTDMKLTTGRQPLIVGEDFMFITVKDNTGKSDNWYYQQQQRIISEIKYSYSQGLITSMTWHLFEPYEEKAFYVSEMSSDNVNKAFYSILEGRENHVWYKNKLTKVAQILNSLKDNSGNLIPVIFRPFHEFDGSWFWWSTPAYTTPTQFKKNWQFTVNYLRDSLNVHNVLYCFSPGSEFSNTDGYQQCYPGDEYVDVLGVDNYEDYSKGIQSGITLVASKLKIVSDLAISKKKVAALSEFGYNSTNTTILNLYTQCFLPLFTKNNLELAYAMFWANTSSNYYVPTPYSTSQATDFRSFANSSAIFEQGDVANVYEFPK
jgi:mannan endo-1,4-beta-mannosidase